MRIQLIIFFFLACVFGATCDVKDTYTGDPNGEGQQTVEELTDTEWQLRSVEEEGYGIFAPETDTMYTIRFFGDGKLEAKDACNICRGEFNIDSTGNMFINNVSCTEIACHGYQHFFNYSYPLNGANAFSIEEDQLYISLSDEDEPYTYKFVDAENTSPKEVIMADPVNFDRSGWQDGNYAVGEAEIMGDTLSLEVSFSGCDYHDFNLVFNNYLMESEPVQASAFLAHRKEDCLTAFSQELDFDLTPLKEEFQNYYGDSGSIDISIREKDETHLKIRYTF